eukprot:jgi/Psemu1/59421/gm1.59421_g
MVTVREEEDKKNKDEAANNTAQIAVATDPTLLQEDNDTDKNKEEAANDTDPIAVAVDPALQEDDTENIEEEVANETDPIEDKEREENKTTRKDYLPKLASSWL